MERIRENVKLILTILYFEISHTCLFHVLSCPRLFCMHLTGRLHCLEELEGLVHVMARFVLIYHGATILEPLRAQTLQKSINR